MRPGEGADIEGLPRHALVVGCNGAFGRLLAARFRTAGMIVTGADRDDAAGFDVPVDAYTSVDLPAVNPSFAERLSAADLAVFCVPEAALVPALGAIGTAMRPEALAMDIVSVKSAIASAVAEWPDAAPAYLGIHPMFGPSADFAGRTVALVPLRPGSNGDAMRALIAGWGCETPVLTAREHDRVTALVQALPHAALLAFGRAIANAGVPVDALSAMATPILRAMLALLVRVAGRDRLTHWSIQTTNGEATAARASLAASLAALDAQVATGAFDAFDTTLDDVIAYLATEVPALKAVGDAIVADTQRPAGPPDDAGERL